MDGNNIRLRLATAFEKFKVSAEGVVPASPFDPDSRIVYSVLALWLITLTLIILASDFSIGESATYSHFLVSFLLMLCALIARRYRMPRLAIWFECFTILPITGALTVVSSVILAAHSFPLADKQLIAADAALGFHWQSFLAFQQAIPGLIRFLSFPYTSFGWQFLLVTPAMALAGERRRIWVLMTAWIIAGLTTVLLFPFAPAEGPYVHFGIKLQDVPELHRVWQWQFGPTIEGLQSGKIRDLSKAMMGLVSLPSFHAAAAIMFAWACARLRWLGTPLVILNVMMIFSTPINGAHYLIDVLAGCAIGLIAIFIARRLIDRGSEA